MPTIPRILTTTALFLAAMGLNSCSAQAAPNQAALEQAEQHIRLQWQRNPKLSYHSLFYKATLQECMESRRFYVRRVRTLQGTWIPVHRLPPETLVFEGKVKGFKPGKTKGGGGYFFCSPETGELVAYLLMKLFRPRMDKNEPRFPTIACKSLFIPLHAMFHFRLLLGEKWHLNY